MDILWPCSLGSAVLIHPPCYGRHQTAQKDLDYVVTVTHTAVAHCTSRSVLKRGPGRTKARNSEGMKEGAGGLLEVCLTF